MAVPFHKATTHKQGDGSYLVRVIHSIGGHSTDVSFPYTNHTHELAEEYAKFKNDQVGKETEAPVVAVAPAPVAPPVVDSAPAPKPVAAPVPAPVREEKKVQPMPAPAPNPIPAPTVKFTEADKVKAAEVVQVPVPEGNDSSYVKALEEDTKEQIEASEPQE